MSTTETVSGQVGPGFLTKADRLFRNDDASIWIEVLQNARRADAKVVQITIEEQASGCYVTVHDDGRGIAKFQDLLNLGDSSWNRETQVREDPAGMGFYALCRCEVEVQSGARSVIITPAVFLGTSRARVEQLPEPVPGTRIRFKRESGKQELVEALERAVEFYPLEVRLNGVSLERHDFLDGSVYREVIDGIEIGFATTFVWEDRSYRNDNWNFYGARIRGEEVVLTGLLRPDRVAPYSIYARFNVLDTGRIKLQLPDRKGIIEDQFYAEFLIKARAAAYRFFQTQEAHALSYKCWKEAKELGVVLPESVCLLTDWHATPADDNAEPTFGECKPRRLTGVSRVVLVDQNLENPHTFEGAIMCGGGTRIDGDLYCEDPQFRGYTWYDKLPRIVATEVLLDGSPDDGKQRFAGRPKKIEIEVTIKQANHLERHLLLDAFIHVDSESSIWDGTCFVAVENSPWDNPQLNGPFSVHAFIIGATFRPSDDSESDSWQTQFDQYEEEVRREVNGYFRGPKASLLAILQQALGDHASALAEQLGVTEIRFTRTGRSQSWSVDLAPDVPTV